MLEMTKRREQATLRQLELLALFFAGCFLAGALLALARGEPSSHFWVGSSVWCVGSMLLAGIRRLEEKIDDQGGERVGLSPPNR